MRHNLKNTIEKLISFESTHVNIGELHECAEWISHTLNSKISNSAVRTDVISVSHIPSVLSVSGNWKEPAILLNGHFDVVEGSPDQFRPNFKDGKIYGRGAADMKGGVAVLMETYIDIVNKHPEISIGLMLTGDEERGGDCGAGYYVKNGWKTDLLINLDGGYGEAISHAEKGILRLTFKCHGSPGIVTQPWASVSAFDLLMTVHSILDSAFPNRTQASESNNWVTTFTPRAVRTSPNRNSVIDYAEMDVSIHFVEDMLAEEVLDMVRSKLPERIEVEQTFMAERVFISPEHPELHRFQDATHGILSHIPEIKGENGTSDARFFADMNIPMIITKPISGNPEQDNEWVHLASCERLTEALITYITKH